MIMKKLLLIVSLMIGIASVTQAQSQYIGARGGNGGELSYQKELSSTNRIEADLGYYYYYGINLTGVYQWVKPIPGVEGLEWFYGGGATISLASYYNSFDLGLAGNIGIDYNFSFPLQIGLDYRPAIMFLGSGFNYQGYAFSARWRF